MVGITSMSAVTMRDYYEISDSEFLLSSTAFSDVSFCVIYGIHRKVTKGIV